MKTNKKNLILFILFIIFLLIIIPLFSSKPSTQTCKILKANENEIKINKIILLNAFIKEDKQKIDELGILPDEYPGGFYKKDLNEVENLKLSKDAKISIFDIEEKYSKNDDKKHLFNNYDEFLIAFNDDLSLKERPYVLTIKNGYVIKIEEKWYN